MGGEGSMMNANTSLNNNRSMLSKRKEKSALGGSYANAKMKEFPEASEQTLKEIQERLKKEHRKIRTKQIIVFFILFIGILTSIFFLIR